MSPTAKPLLLAALVGAGGAVLIGSGPLKAAGEPSWREAAQEPRTKVMDGVEVVSLRAPRRDGSHATAYVAVRSGDAVRPRPTLVLLHGSGCTSPFAGEGALLYKPFLFTDLVAHLDEWQLVAVEKRGVKLGFSPAGATDGRCPAEYDAHASLGSRVEDTVAVIDLLVREGLHADGPLVVIGHSEGAEVAPSVALGSPHVSHVALLGWSATHGLADVLDGQRRALAAGRISAQVFRQRYDQLVTRFREIRARPSSAERYYGHSFKRWASFGLGQPLEDLLQVRVPIFLGIASEDASSPPFGADVAVAECVSHGMGNLTVRNYVGCDHGFFEESASGSVSRQAEVARDLLAWIHSHLAARPQTQLVPGPQLRELVFDRRGADFADWADDFEKKVHFNWAPPRYFGYGGSVEFVFAVERNGSVSALEMVKSSGTGPLDQAAQEALLRSRFDPLPEAFGPLRATMRVTLAYGPPPGE